MYEDIHKIAEEIKRRLMDKGQDVDETVICELLHSVESDYGMDGPEHIINMITDENSDFGKPPDKAESSSTEIKSEIQCNIEKFPEPDTQSSFIECPNVETIDVFSDSDNDMDFYYDTSNSNDISVIDTVTTGIDTAPTCSLLEQCCERLATANNDNGQTIATRNNTQDKVEFFEENNNEVVYVKSVKYDKNRLSKSPKPGCSKDPDDTSSKSEEFCNSCNFDELQKDAEQIYALLPKLNYNLIYEILCNNKFAKNRIELTLWDLLPDERPTAQFVQKRKSSDEIHLVECKKNPPIFPPIQMNPVDLRTILEKKSHEYAKDEIKAANDKLKIREFTDQDDITRKTTGQTENGIEIANKSEIREFASKTDEIDKMEKNVIQFLETKALDNMGNDTNQQNMIPISEANLSKLDTSNNNINICNEGKKSASSGVDPKNKELQLIKDSAVPYKIEASNNVDSVLTQSVIIRPARFTFNTSVTSALSLSTSSSPILAPAKLNIIENSLQERHLKAPLNISFSNIKEKSRENIIQPHSSGNSVKDYTSASLNEAPMNTKTKLTKTIQTKTKFTKNPKRIVIYDDGNIAQPHSSVNFVKDYTAASLNKVPPDTKSKIKFVKKDKRIIIYDDKNIAQPHSSVNSVNDYTAAWLNKIPSNIEMKTKNMAKHAGLLFFDSIPQMLTESKASTDDFIHSLRLFNERADNLKQQGDSMSTPQVCNRKDENSISLALSNMERNARQEKTKNKPKITHKEIVLNEKAREVYYKLIPMFPSVKTDYIKQICQSVITDNTLLDEARLLQHIVDHLLMCNLEDPHIEKVEPLPTHDLNEQYADLLGIFPEADPVYLREIAEKIYNDPEQIKQFVQSKLENPDYPTRAQYLAKKKITEQQKQYTTGFQVQQFLDIFPDPFSHFEDAKRQCQFNPHAVDFLKHYFSKIRVNTLLYTYSQYGNNLSLTAKALETINGDMKTKRYGNRMVLTEDIPLLQECAFIEHKVELAKYLSDLKTEEEREFNELKAHAGLLECQCCYDDECMPSKCSACEDGHIFCNLCIVRSTDVILADGKTHVDCLINCGSEFPLSVLQHVLPPTKFSILLCKRQEAEVMAAGVEGLVSCPFCHFASIPPPEDKVFKCLNPDCMKESCRLCKEINHIPLRCNEAKSDVARLYLEEKMTAALVRKCYRCGRTFFKEEGCNKMTCVCGAQMCYICDKPVTNYGHFQGQGAGRSNLCPLWSDDRHMNAKTVIAVCRETMKHIKETNPTVDINVDALLPTLPPRSRGPHEDIAQVNERANRIVRQFP